MATAGLAWFWLNIHDFRVFFLGIPRVSRCGMAGHCSRVTAAGHGWKAWTAAAAHVVRMVPGGVGGLSPVELYSFGMNVTMVRLAYNS